MNNTVRNFKNV